MNALKHMEAIFLAAVVGVAATSFASNANAAPAPAPATATAAATAAVKNASRTVVKFANEGKMAIVTITAKRLVAVAKAQVR